MIVRELVILLYDTFEIVRIPWKLKFSVIPHVFIFCPNRSTSPCDDSRLSQPELEQSFSAGQISSGIRSGLGRHISASSLQCSPEILAQQSCISILDQPFSLSSEYRNLAFFPSAQPLEAQELHSHGLPATDQQQSCSPKHDHHQRSNKLPEGSNGQTLSKHKNKSNYKHKDNQAAEIQFSDTVVSSPSDSCPQRNGKVAVLHKVNSSITIINTLENGSIGREKPCKGISETQEYRKNGVSRTLSSRGSKSFSASLKSNKNGKKTDKTKSNKSSRGSSSSSNSKESSHQGKSVGKDHEISANHTGRDSAIQMQMNDCSGLRNTMASDQQQLTPNYNSKTHMSESGRIGQHEESEKQQEAFLQTNSSSSSSTNIQDGLQPNAPPFSVFPLSSKHSSSSHSSSSHSSSSYSLSNNNLSTNINSNKDFLIKVLLTQGS